MIEVEQVRELLSKATPGPWAYKAGNMKHYAHSTDPGEDFGVSLQEMHWQDGREVPAEGNARLIAAAPDIAALALAQAAEIARLREALERVHKLQVGWWEEVIALMDPDADMTPALEERAEVLKRINHQLHAATQGSQ